MFYQDDDKKRLRSTSASDNHELARWLSLPNDAGPESIMTGDEYLQPRSNGVVPAAAPSNPAVSHRVHFLDVHTFDVHCNNGLVMNG